MQAFLLFSHQPFPEIVKQPRHTVIFLIEDTRHFQKKANPARAVFHRAALQATRERLLVKGFVVRYLGADEYATLKDALTMVTKEVPEVVRYFTPDDPHVERQLHAFLVQRGTPVQAIPSPAPHVLLRARESYVPEVLPPIDPNRYVQEAAAYFMALVPSAREFEFAYPVTPGDAEEWLDLIPTLLDQEASVQQLAQDIAPVLAAGLITLSSLQEALREAQVSSERVGALWLLLTGM